MADKDDRDGETAGITLAHQRPLHIGSLLIEPALRRVTDREGREEFVEPRVMQVLVALIHAEGAILSRDDLIERCWDGRIVGDDAINRVLSRLRRLAEGIGAGSFTVETITKVGYRLATADGGPLATEPVAVPAATRRLPPLKLGATALLLVALTLALWVLPRIMATPADAPQVRLAHFDMLSPNLPVRPDDIRTELLVAFGTDSLDVITDDKPPGATRHVYRLGGAIGGDERTLRFVTFLTDETSGGQIWTNKVELPASEAAKAPRMVAALASQIVRCTLSGIAEQGRRQPERVVALYAGYCGEIWADDANDERVIDLARRVTEAAPDFARGWSGLALAEAIALRDRSRPNWDAMHDEAGRAATAAVALDPRNSESYAAKAMLLPIADFAGREAMHRKSIEVEPGDCGCEHQYYAAYLAGVGRSRDAVFEAKRGHDMEPLSIISTWRWADMLYSTGHKREGDSVLQDALAFWPNTPLLFDLDLRAALATGDYHRGEARAKAMGDAGRDAAMLFGALESGAKAPALARFRALAADPATNNRFVVDALGALGDNVAALAAIDRLFDSLGSKALLALYDPSLAAARATPGFAALAGRSGLTAYWRSTHKRPDFCQAAGAPPICGTI